MSVAVPQPQLPPESETPYVVIPRRRESRLRRTVVVGTNGDAEAFEQRLRKAPRLRQAQRNGAIWVEEMNGDSGALLQRLVATSPDDVYFLLHGGVDEDALAAIGSRLLMEGIAVHMVLPQAPIPPVSTTSVAIGGQSVISLAPVRDAGAARIARRFLDVVGAVAGLLVLSPVMAFVAISIRRRMGKPIFYVSERVGQYGRRFPLYKFRSMVSGADRQVRASSEAYDEFRDSNFKLAGDDPRITPLGAWLRRTSLDELPQLWNVLRGDMSLVGPRAVVPDELEEYGDYAQMLLRVKPGLTGIWQVSGRSSIGYPERARMDLHYLGTRTLKKDIQVLLRTLPAVIRQRGAL